MAAAVDSSRYLAQFKRRSYVGAKDVNSPFHIHLAYYPDVLGEMHLKKLADDYKVPALPHVKDVLDFSEVLFRDIPNEQILADGVKLHRVQWNPFGVYQPIFRDHRANRDWAFEFLKEKLATPLAMMEEIIIKNNQQCMLVERCGTNAGLLVAAVFLMKHKVPLVNVLQPLIDDPYYSRNGTASHIHDFLLLEMALLGSNSVIYSDLKKLFQV